MMENGNVYESEPHEEVNTLDETDATQAVQVALNIRPLIALERIQGCRECITVVPGEPQVVTLLIVRVYFGRLYFLQLAVSCGLLFGCLRILNYSIIRRSTFLSNLTIL